MFTKVSCLALALVFSSSAFAVQPGYYDIKSATIQDVTAIYAPYLDLFEQPGIPANCNQEDKPVLIPIFSGQIPTPAAPVPNVPTLPTTPTTPTHPPYPTPPISIDPVAQVGVIVDEIINIGKKIWGVVEAGKPVINIKTDLGNALPKGLTCWSDMGGWGVPQTKVFSVNYINGLNMNVVSFTFRVSYIAKGNVNGIGKYIANATILPANLIVAWGYQFDATATVDAPFNQGTREAPLAGLQMNLNWKISTAVRYIEHTESFFVSGDEQLVHLE